MSLTYITQKDLGYTRKRIGKNFMYLDKDGKPVRDKEEIKRIKSLVIPPAWQNVWISTKANGHLQATGYDVAGRKQYKYHLLWSQHRNAHKHNRMAEFARALQSLRRQIERDLRKKEFTREKVLALALTVMDKTCIRVGNSAYTKLYGSYGLTSLRNKHIQIKGSQMMIAFTGKKGVYQEIKLTHSRLCKMMKRLRDIPGQELFQYYDENGEKKSLKSEDINTYILQHTGKDFTAKDFRTWWGTVTAITSLAAYPKFQTATEAKQNVNQTLEMVANKLGNTKTVCKKYYIHPLVFTHYEDGKLHKYLEQIINGNATRSAKAMQHEEKIVLNYLQRMCK